MSHSKRNTSRAVFTAHERSLAKAAWSVSSARLTRESFLPFAACSLCLEPAQDPVVCPGGDVFCRECALNNLLAQKKEQQRQQRLWEQEEREREERREREDAEAQAHAVAEFELAQAGLAKGRGQEREQEKEQTKEQTKEQDTELPRPPKRKLDDDLRRVVGEDRARARRAIEAERAAAKDATALPSFWTPSETPGGSASKTARTTPPPSAPPPSKQPTACPAARDGHAYSLRTLVSVRFSEDAAGQRVCPACKRTLSNASRAVLARPCGHVLCRSCVHQFVRPLEGGSKGEGALLHDPHAPGSTGVRCYVCEEDLEEDGKGKENGKGKEKSKRKKEKERIKPGLVELRSEGTGFSAGGASEVKKEAVAFQC